LPAEDDRPDKPKAAPEKESVVAFLDYHRATLISKVRGLTKEQATRRLVPSETTLLGIMKHLAHVEAWWFQDNFAGRDVPDYPWSDDDPDADFRIEPDESVESIVALYESKIEASRAIVEPASLDELSVRAPRGTQRSLRWIVLHMIEETARHVGHADILRELTDGATGE
jgi:hypothetical protein